MTEQVDAAIKGWFEFLTTDPQTLGVVGWLGIILGLVSLAVTVAGFLIALKQIRKIKQAADAAQEAVDAVRTKVIMQDMTTGLTEARASLKLARVLMNTNLGAAGAYIDTSCNSLTQVHHLRGARDDDVLLKYILSLRVAVRFLQSAAAPAPSQTRARAMYNDVDAAAVTIDGLLAQSKYQAVG